MRDNQKLFEDVVSLGGNILGNVLGSRFEMRAQAKEHMSGLLRHLDLVTREEFNAAFAMLAKSRAVQEEILERLAVIESHLNLSSPKQKKKTMKANLPSVKKGNQAKK